MYGGSQNFFRGIAGGVFLIFLALSFMTGHFWWPMIFVGLAFASLFGSLSAGNPRAIYGGVMGFIWMIGFAACAAFNFWWPGMLIIVGVSAIAGTLFRPMMSGQVKTEAPQQPYYQPSQPQQQPEQPYYQPYQEGYQPPQEGYQEGGKVHPYPEQPQVQEYEQPQAQYPQELPPQQS